MPAPAPEVPSGGAIGGGDRVGRGAGAAFEAVVEAVADFDAFFLVPVVALVPAAAVDFV